MTYLFFDTETTGLPRLDRSVMEPGQPNICQIGAILGDDTGETQCSLNVIIRPDGWIIPTVASDIHRITMARALRFGVPIERALRMFLALVDRADTIVAHNLDFDEFMIRRELAAASINEAAIVSVSGFCTMKASAPILNLPPTQRMTAAGISRPKSPRLQEAYRHFFDRDFEGAHDAMADVRACREVFMALKGHHVPPAGPAVPTT